MSTFSLPDLGEGLSEAEIVDWHVTPGDHVVTDQPLVSVETDKAVVEIPSPVSGRVDRLLVKPGEIVAVGAVLCEIDTGPGGQDAGAIVGALPQASAPPPARPAAAPGRARATPAVRRLALQRGVDLATLAGSGPGGAITGADVERAAAATAPEGWEPLRSVRRAMARNMADAHSRIATTTVTDDADVTGWGAAGHDITIRLARAIAAACAVEPALNAWFDGERLARRLHPRLDLGIAVDAADGLFVPVLRDVGNRAPEDLRRGLERMRAAIASRAIPLAELRDPTLTLSNFGRFGGRHAALMVVPPQVAILGAGRVYRSVGLRDGAPEERLMLPLSLSFDHRAATGGEAARFLRAVVVDLER